MNSGFSSYTPSGAPVEPVGQSGALIRVHDTVNRVSIGDGEVTEGTQAFDKGSTAELNPYRGTESVFATAMAPNGAPVTEILPDTLVTIGGTQAPVSFWVSEGLLQKAPDGTYVEASGSPAQAPQVDQGDILPIADTTMTAINAALAEVDQGNLDGLIGVGMGVAVGRLDAAALAYKFGQASGLDATESNARLTTIKAAFQSQADTALTTRSGLDASDLPEFYAWAKANRQGALQEAIQKQVRGHDVSGYRALADQWMSATPPSVQALKAAGVPVRQQGQGSEIFLRGSWMSPGAAAKAGLI